MRIEQLLAAARKAGASDIHLVTGLPPAFRVGGEIIMAQADALTPEACHALAVALLTDEQRELFEREHELSVSTHTPIGRVRVSLYLHIGRPEAAIRICHERIPDAAALGLPPVVEELARRGSGLVLVTGPTGAGKTTTLNHMVDLVNQQRRCKIVTIEDPVEYVHRPARSIVIQQEVRTDARSFSSALRHVLRLDPDVIAVGEMRDLETIETALTAAETGHLVLATLHTPSASQSVERIVGAFPSSQQNQIAVQLADSLQGIIAQKLLPRASGSGRVLACETLVGTLPVRNMIRDLHSNRLLSVMQTSAAEGMRTMDAALEELYRRGDITWDCALSHARDPIGFREKLSSNARVGGAAALGTRKLA